MSDDWQKQVDWMRKNGVISAKWQKFQGDADAAIVLVECITGPVVEPLAGVGETAEEMKERHEREQREAEETRDFGAS